MGGGALWFWVPTAKRTPGAVAVGQKNKGAGGLSRTYKELSGGGLSEGHFLSGL